MKRKRQTLTLKLMAVSVLPLLALGLVLSLATSAIVYTALRAEVEQHLGALVRASYRSFEAQYPGDYAWDGERLTKGGASLMGRHDLVDEVKALSGADVSLFRGDERLLTTIIDPDGGRAVGTRAAAEVTRAVLEGGEEFFSDHVMVDGMKYFGYYMPVKNGDGSVQGMAFAGKPRGDVMAQIGRNIGAVCLAVMLATAAAAAASCFFSGRIIYSLHATEAFLEKIARGDLAAKIDPYVLGRRDEIGEMGRFAVMLQRFIENQVGTDPLTGLPNRRSCDAVLEGVQAKHARKGAPYAIAMGDIDLFKAVNDVHGHQAGDEVLRQVAGVLAAQMERQGFVFRWGGEEFLLVYEDVGRREALASLCALRQAVAAHRTMWKGSPIAVTMTFGLASGAEAGEIRQVLQRADANLYQGKRQGRDRIVCTGGDGA